MKPTENVRLFDALDEAIEWAEDCLLDEQGLGTGKGAEKPLALEQIELLREFESDQTLAALRECVVERSVAASQTIFHREDQGDELFLIRRGVVLIQLPLDSGKHHNLAYFGRGNFFGEMSFLDRGRRSADALALTDTDLFVISRRCFDELSKRYSLVGVKIFARLARVLAIRLRYTDAEVRALQES